MVRELVSLHVGRCGNALGAAAWPLLADEHHIDPNGADNTLRATQKLHDDHALAHAHGRDVLFRTTSAGRALPRAVLVDLEPSSIDALRASTHGALFSPDNVVIGHSGAANNWAQGHYTEGMELLDDVMDVVRREAEHCDSLQGFALTHSLGGGTGAGLGTLLLSKISEEYPDRMFATYSVRFLSA